MTGLKVKVTPRRFAIVGFDDKDGRRCDLQESSAVEPACVWLGTGSERMHLTQSMIEDLLPYLQLFAETGQLTLVWCEEEQL